MTQKNIAIIIAKGFEPAEMVVPLDILIRAGNNVDIISLSNDKIVASQISKPRINVDFLFDEVENWDFYDALVLPGGEEAEVFLKSKKLAKLVRDFNSKSKTIGAICASGGVLGEYGVLDNRNGTAYPGYGKAKKVNWLNKRVVVDNNIITSQGPGTSFEFALALVSKINSKEITNSIKQGMLIQ